jgi:glycosyltransferase involved in cell wall biosynthesis
MSRSDIAARPTIPLRGPATVTVSVVVCAYTEDRWSLLGQALASLRAQSRSPDQVVLVVDHCEALYERALATYAGVHVVRNLAARGLSGARNTGVTVATSDIVAFLDDDAAADPAWVERLASAYVDPSVMGVGGSAEADWQQGRPRWFPHEFDWVVGCTYRGLPTEVGPVRNFVGANMSYRRSTLARVGPFATSLGRVGALPLGCEETEFGIRARRAFPHGRFLYLPDATVRHHVPAARSTIRYFYRRCWSEGLSKATVAALATTSEALESERRYVTRVLPRAVAEAIGSARHGGLRRAFVIVAGLTVTSAGYLRGRLNGHGHGRNGTPC